MPRPAQQRWRFDPRSEREDAVGNRQRGLAYWADGQDRRVFTSAGTWLYALDATTGKPVRTFGDNGVDPPRARARARRHAVGAAQHAGRRVQEPADRRRPDPRERGRRHQGLRRADRRTEMDVSHDPPARRGGLRHVAARCLEDGGRRLGLVGPLGRRSARHRLRLDRNRRSRLLGRRSVRREPVREFGRRARCGDRQAPVALPDRPPRPVGSGPAGPADPAHRHASGQAHRCARAGHQARAAVCLRSRHRRTALAGARTPDDAVAHPRREGVADAAGAREAGAADAAAVHGGRRLDHLADGDDC